MERASTTKAGARSESSGLAAGRAYLSRAHHSAEQQPMRVIHIDADNAVVLGTRFVRQGGRRDANGPQGQAELSTEACCAKDFASNLLAEFMWGTLDAETGQWKPVGEVPSCDPPDQDDSLITYGQFLRTRHTAAEPDDPQVCENIRRALQSFGQAGSNKQGAQRSTRRRQQTEGNPAQADRMKTANPEDVLKSVHTQLMKRMALPLTVRLGLNCETPNPEEILAQVPASPDDSTGELSPDPPSTERQPSTERADACGSALLGSLSSTSEARSEPTPDADDGLYRARMNQGYWYTMPYLFHTLFTWIKQRVAFKLVFYTRDHIGGKHIGSLVREFNDLCEGRHPAFDGENRTKQVFLDGRKKSSPDLRISPVQIGCVSISTRGPVASASAVEEIPQKPRCATQEGPECATGKLERPSASEDRLQSPVWTAVFPAEELRYHGIQEIYAGITHDLLARHTVICLCFGTPPPPKKSSLPLAESSASSSPERADDPSGSETVRAEHLEDSPSSPTVSRSRRGSLRRASHASATAKGLDEIGAAERSPSSRCCSSGETVAISQGLAPPAAVAENDAAGQSTGCQGTMVKFTLSNPLAPLPVLVDPADFTLFHVCISSPSVPSVLEGLVCVSTLNVVEAVHGSALFHSGRATNPAAALPQASPRSAESHLVRTEAPGQGEHLGGAESAPSLSPAGMLRARLTVDLVYTVLVPEPCSLLCNPDYICNLVEESVSQRRRMIEQTDPLSADWRPMSLWSSGAPTSESAEAESLPGARNGQGKTKGSDPSDGMTTECPKPRFLKSLDRFAGLSAEEVKSLPTREYLKATVIPVLLPAIEQISKDRPENPLVWIAFYLLRHATHFNRTVRPAEPQVPLGLIDISRPQSPREGQDTTARTTAANIDTSSKKPPGVIDERL